MVKVLIKTITKRAYSTYKTILNVVHVLVELRTVILHLVFYVLLWYDSGATVRWFVRFLAQLLLR